MSITQSLDHAINEGDGILHMMPCWVPRAFAVPGTSAFG